MIKIQNLGFHSSVKKGKPKEVKQPLTEEQLAQKKQQQTLLENQQFIKKEIARRNTQYEGTGKRAG